MSLPLFLVDALPVGPSYVLAGPEGRHAAAVQRMRAGERLLREFARSRGEEVAELSKQGGFFSRMRDAFNGHA